MLLSILSLAAGLVLLTLAGDFLVKGAVGLSERFGISPLVIGLTVVAFGTSAPELVVSVQAALAGSPGIAIGNVIGSNIANVFLVLGLPALIAPVVARQPKIRRNITAMIAITIVFMLLLAGGTIGRIGGGLLFGTLLAFIAWQVFDARSGRAEAEPDFHDDLGETPHETGRVLAYLAAGIVGLPVAAHLTVTGASAIARDFGISEAVIGLTIVAIGTSLPELMTTLVAALRRTQAVAIGNVVGSNIFNIAGIMGLTALITPVDVEPRIVAIDMWVMFAAVLALGALGYFHIRGGKAVGAAMLAAYAAYMITMF